jgi:hypothetical protein
MCLAQDNDLVHTFTPDRADQPFDKANAASHSDEVFRYTQARVVRNAAMTANG